MITTKGRKSHKGTKLNSTLKTERRIIKRFCSDFLLLLEVWSSAEIILIREFILRGEKAVFSLELNATQGDQNLTGISTVRLHQLELPKRGIAESQEISLCQFLVGILSPSVHWKLIPGLLRHKPTPDIYVYPLAHAPSIMHTQMQQTNK